MKRTITLNIHEIAKACAYWFARTQDLSGIPADVTDVNVDFQTDGYTLTATLVYSTKRK